MATIVLIALWPAVCMSTEAGPTTCQSALLLPLPWGETADTWASAVALGASLLTLVTLRWLLRHRSPAH
jgi:hypothetical protein